MEIRFYVWCRYLFNVLITYFVHFIYLHTTVISLSPREHGLGSALAPRNQWVESHWQGESLNPMTPLFGLSVFHLQWLHFFWPTLFFLTRSTLGTISLGYASCEWILLFKACLTLLTIYFGCTYSPLKLNTRLYQTRMHAQSLNWENPQFYEQWTVEDSISKLTVH